MATTATTDTTDTTDTNNQLAPPPPPTRPPPTPPPITLKLLFWMMGVSRENRTESTIIVHRNQESLLVDREMLKARIRSEWCIDERVTIDLVFEDDARELQRTVHVMLRGAAAQHVGDLHQEAEERPLAQQEEQQKDSREWDATD